MKKEYPYIEIVELGEYKSAIIHLSEKEETLAMVTQEDLCQKMMDLIDKNKLTRYHYHEFLRKSVLAGMINQIDFEINIDEIEPELNDLFRKFQLKMTLFNPFSKKPSLRDFSIEEKMWLFSGPNFFSEPFKSKEEGLQSIKKLFNEGEKISAKEIEICYRLLNDTKEVPGTIKPSDRKSIN